MTRVALFLLAVFAVPWALLFVLRPVAAQNELWALAWILPTVWAPTIVALILVRSADGGGAVTREIRRRLRYTPGSGRWLVLAGAVPAVAVALAVLAARSAGGGGPFIPARAIPVTVMVVLQLLTGAVGEELGWRGFLLPRLGQRFGEMRAAWLMAIAWSLWHVAGFLFPGMPHELMPPVPALLSIVLFGVILAFLFNRTGESVRATILAHLSLNIASGFGGVQFSSEVFWWTLVVIFGALVFLTTIITLRTPALREGRTS